jgi:hypothetical protein
MSRNVSKELKFKPQPLKQARFNQKHAFHMLVKEKGDKDTCNKNNQII